MDAAQRDLYREIFLDHSQAPRNRGEPGRYDTTAQHRDPATGDAVTLWLDLQGDTLAGIHWEAQGSSVLSASCSLMSEALAGKSIVEARALIECFIAMLTGEDEKPDWQRLGESAALSGIRHLPARVRCASLPWRTAESALATL